MCNFSEKQGKDVCPLHPNMTYPNEWATIVEEYVLRESDNDEYFYDNVAGFLIDDRESETTYTVWFSNEAGSLRLPES